MNVNELMPMEGQSKGIVSGGSQPQPGSETEQNAGPTGGQQSPEGQESASPEEQQIYEKVVLAGVNILNEKAEELMQIVKQGESPSEAVAQTTFLIVSTLDEQTGGNVPDDVLLHASMEIIENVADTAVQAGIDISQEQFGKAVQLFLKKMVMEMGYDPKEAEAVINQMDPGQIEGIMQEQSQYAMAQG